MISSKGPKRAILITGFSNWGKTTLIRKLFPGKVNFLEKNSYQIDGVARDFSVESVSNDDLSENLYIKKITGKTKKPCDLISAFCPTIDKKNNACRILKSATFSSFDEIHLLLLKYKWDMHASLEIENIQNNLRNIGNLKITVILCEPKDHLTEIKTRIHKIYKTNFT